MSTKFFNIRKYDDSIEFSTLLGLYNTMARYLNPAAIEINEETTSILLSNNPNFIQNSLIFETFGFYEKEFNRKDLSTHIIKKISYTSNRIRKRKF